MKKKRSRTKDRCTAVLENIQSDFKAFGESLDFIHDEAKSHSRRFDTVDERLMKVESDLEFVKSELAIIRHNQVTRDEFKLLETRVLRLEKRTR